MLPRILEPEVMDTVLEAADYDAMNHSQVNVLFVDDLLAVAGTSLSDNSESKILDVGTGTALIPIELCQRETRCHVTAIDLAGEMLKVARHNVERAALASRVDIEQIDAKQMPYADAAFDAVISNSIVHHIPKPRAVLAEMLRVLRPGGILFVRDLLRPADVEPLEQLVQTYAGDENGHQQQMFRDSLHAALTLEEIRELLISLDIVVSWATQTTDRHWTIAGRMAE